jgi:hypothetical protein
MNFCCRFTQFNTKFDLQSTLHDSGCKYNTLTELLLMDYQWLDMLTPAMCW